ncbi:MAG: hypothetical protein R2939_21410 [Kofleriaceae bacterium]
MAVPRSTWIAGAVAVTAAVAAVVLWRDNVALREAAGAQAIAARAEPAAAAPVDPWLVRPSAPAAGAGAEGAARPLNGPSLPPAPPPESRLDRRVRRTDELAAMFARLDGETDAEFQARLGAMIGLFLDRPRASAAEMRREAFARAGVTPAQGEAIDAELARVYDEVIDYADAAIASGEVSPYQRNLPGLLEFAGGLGGLLREAETSIGGVLSPTQRQALYDAGFDWGEYLGVAAPWERVRPPPPR